MNVFTPNDKFTLEITQQCPNKCMHCSSNSTPNVETKIPLEQAKHLVNEAVDLGAKNIVLSGGEPLIYPNLFSLVEHINGRGANVIIYTSGSVFTGLDPVEVKNDDFKKYKELGISRFNLSLHSHTPEIHDEFMQVPGSWKRAMTFLERAIEHNIEVHVHTVITHLNYGEISRLAICLEKKGVKELRLLRLVPQGRAKNPEVFKRLEPTDADWVSVRRQLTSFQTSNNGGRKISIHLGAHLSNIGKIPGVRDYDSCSLDQGKLIIEPDGTVSVCPALKGIKEIISKLEPSDPLKPLQPPNALQVPQLRDIMNSPWRTEVATLKGYHEYGCPAQHIYREGIVTLTPPLSDPNAAPIQAVTLTDSYLIECLDRNLGRLGFPDDNADTIRKAVKGIRALKEFGKPEFSLFYYSSQATHAKNGKGLIPLDEVWQAALEGAIHVLKQHDLRENPTRYNQNEPDWEITRPPIDEIASYYKQAAEFERVIYGFDPWYRDHFAHVIKVWLIGLHVIENLDDKKLIPPDLTGIEELNDSLFESEELYAAFTISALTHDLGYPLQKVAKLNQVLSRMLEAIGGVDWQPLQFSLSLPRHQTAQHLLNHLSSKPRFREFNGHEMDSDSISRKVGQRLDEYKRATSVSYLQHANEAEKWGVVLRSQWKYHEKYHDSLERNHHGLLSALLLLRKLLFLKEGEFALEEDYFFSLEEARQFMVRREILRALATHTCPEIYVLNLLSVESLLFFCDEIQEWGRPQFSDLYQGRTDSGPTTVTLSQYDRSKVHWVVNVGELQQSSAAHWLLSSGRKLFDRLRSAPESPERDFDVQWALCWKHNSNQYCGTFLFEGKKGTKARSELSFIIKNLTTKKEDTILPFITSLGSGKKMDDVQRELMQLLDVL
jgi:MoaA/NifB/PqqE/SkfB family radical SAM enzyme